ncbi:MAG: class I SAM-dependent methyltransferase [Candidatus Andersenbacteria bacterium]|nr:class I SAM-dependent methyltransferase [Candidatus Andersenbacteria bacterium]MBI3250285.1 class I SAM-dependent methyltransferase [Candidatus Andersenbacteria bacterium]
MKRKLSDYSEETSRAYDSFPDFYEEKFQEFFDNFGKELAEKFVPLLKGKSILDVGCGPGHFGEFFQAKGLKVLGIDISPAMVTLSQKRKVSAKVLDMKDIGSLETQFSGIWASASLLHEPKSKAKEIINIFRDALVPQTGLLFISVKEGTQEGFEVRENQPGTKRWFSHFTDDEMREFLKKDFEILLSLKTNVEGKFNFLDYYARRKRA